MRSLKLWSLAATVAVLAIAGGSGVSTGSAARADGAQPVSDGMPSQSQEDMASTDPGNSMHSAGWADLPGGVSARPYVSALSVTNGDVTTPIVVGGTTSVPALSTGDLSTVISPLNLCPAGVAPQANRCYATPNRFGLTLTYATGPGTEGHDFEHPSVPVSPAVGPDTVVDMTVALNSLGKDLRWTWVSGDLLSWQTSDLGRDDATVHLRFKPAPAPFVQTFPADNGCTATPIFNCSVSRADADQLSASIVFSLDQTLDPVLTGAVFATQDAFYGFLSPQGSPQAPSLDIQLSSTHQKADGTPQLGTLQAFLPAATLANLYGILPADAAAVFTTTRAGDPGSNDRPTYTPWTAASEGSDGVLVTVRDITFSSPQYRVAAKTRAVAVKARAAKGRTTLTAILNACTRKAPCTASVYDLGPAKAPRFAVHSLLVLKNHSVSSKELALTITSSRLAKSHRFLLVAHAVKGHALVASTVGTVA